MLSRLVRKEKKYNSRFNCYNPIKNVCKPDVVGIINNQNDYELGTPSLDRKENVTLIASSSNDEAVLVKLQWRPLKESGGFVCLKAKFILELDGCHYENEQTLVYEPTISSVRQNRITQYGGSNSNLKFSIGAPYRRMRLTFRGYMRNKDLPCDSKFIKVNFVVNPTAHVFDFLSEISAEHAKEQKFRAKLKCDLKEAVKQLVSHDRHEQLIQIKGEYNVLDQSLENKTRIFYGWGFYARHFLDENSQKINTKRILAHAVNGRSFHICLASNDKGQLDYGFSSFNYRPTTKSIRKPIIIDWSLIKDDTQEFQLEVVNQGHSLKCKGSRRNESSLFFDFLMNGKPGWAYISLNDAIDSVEEQQLFDKHGQNLHNALKESRIARQLPFNSENRPLVVSLSDPSSASSELVGSKACSLAQLHTYSTNSTDANFIVPSGIVLTRFAYDSFLEHNKLIKGELTRLETIIGEGRLSDLRTECEHIKRLVETSKFPEFLRKKLVEGLKENCLEDCLLAVRSSSWGEDEDDMSAAGQLSTVLCVQGVGALLNAIMSCFASKFNFANVEYKRQRGLPQSLPMAVVVQSMVSCEKAGVMFTCDPTTGDDSVLIITANYGLGESVVSGQSDPDSIKVRNKCRQNCIEGEDLNIEEFSVGQKNVIIDVESLRGNNSTGVQYDRSRCCLSDDEIFKLAECGLKMTKYFQGQRDIEWGFAGDQLYLFQSRPITSLNSFNEFDVMHEADQPSRAQLDFFSRANIAEVMPYALSPLTLSYNLRLWFFIQYRLEAKVRGLKNMKFGPETAHDSFINAYHLFLGMKGPAFNMKTSNGEKHALCKAIELSFFGHELNEQPDLAEAIEDAAAPQINTLLMNFLKIFTLNIRTSPFKLINRERARLVKLRADVRACKLAFGYKENKLLGLYNQMKSLLEFGFDGWHLHSFTIMISNEYNSNLLEQLSKHIKDTNQLYATFARFLAISPNVLSAEIPERIKNMANIINNKGHSEVEKFLALTFEEAVKYLKSNEDKSLTSAFEEFIERFGHRCYHEFDVSSKSWSDEPGEIVEMVRKNCMAMNVKNERFELNGADNKTEASIKIPEFKSTNNNNETVLDSLKLDLSLKDKFILEKISIPDGQKFVAIRELTKDAIIYFVDVCREAIRMLAKELVRELRLPDENLIFYLFYDEIESIVREPQPALVIQALRRMNVSKKVFNRAWRYDEIIRGYELLPDHMKPSKVLDEATSNAPRLFGTPASSGKVQAKVCLVPGYQHLDKVHPGDILVAHSTDIAFSPIFPLISGIITEVGGLISHGAVVAREYGLPCVLGIPDVNQILEDGEEIILDADNGTIIRLSK